MRKYFIEDMTSPEIKDAIKNGRKNILLIIGAMEQHGPHLPINTDTLSAYSIGEELVKKLETFLVAPIIPIGCSEHHMNFKGTITLSYETLKSYLVDVCKSLDRHGFQNIAILTTHGGNIPPILKFIDKLNESSNANVFFAILDNFDEIVDKVVRKKLGEKIKDHEIHSCHACLHETSFMLNKYPKTVRVNKIEMGRIKSFNHEELLKSGDLSLISPNGILGDPRFSSEELGEELEKAIVEADIKIIKSKIIN